MLLVIRQAAYLLAVALHKPTLRHLIVQGRHRSFGFSFLAETYSALFSRLRQSAAKAYAILHNAPDAGHAVSDEHSLSRSVATMTNDARRGAMMRKTTTLHDIGVRKGRQERADAFSGVLPDREGGRRSRPRARYDPSMSYYLRFSQRVSS
jgi:hypothetical protein